MFLTQVETRKKRMVTQVRLREEQRVCLMRAHHVYDLKVSTELSWLHVTAASFC